MRAGGPQSPGQACVRKRYGASLRVSVSSPGLLRTLNLIFDLVCNRSLHVPLPLPDQNRVNPLLLANVVDRLRPPYAPILTFILNSAVYTFLAFLR